VKSLGQISAGVAGHAHPSLPAARACSGREDEKMGFGGYFGVGKKKK